MLIKKLPQIFQQNQLICNLARYFQGKQIYFSSIVYVQDQKKYIIKKTLEAPYFELDWQCYSFIRCLSKTLITSGNILRTEKDLFKSNFCCGDENISQMYDNFKGKYKQNVYVMTNSMRKQEKQIFFNKELYNILENDQQKYKNQEKLVLHEVLQNLKLKQMTPALIQCGPTIIKQYFQHIISTKKQNLIDCAYIAYFQGELKAQCIGNEFSFQQEFFQLIWESQRFQVLRQNTKIGEVYFKIYSGKISNK